MKVTRFALAMVCMCLLGACAADTSDLAQEKEQFQAAMSLRLNEVDVRLDDLRKRVAQASGDTRVELESQLEELTLQEQELRAAMDDVASASRDEWAQLRGDIESLYDELESDLNTLVQKLDDGTSVGQL